MASVCSHLLILQDLTSTSSTSPSASKVTAAQCESAIKLDRLLAKLGKKAPAASIELGAQRGTAKVTARQALIG